MYQCPPCQLASRRVCLVLLGVVSASALSGVSDGTQAYSSGNQDEF